MHNVVYKGELDMREKRNRKKRGNREGEKGRGKNLKESPGTLALITGLADSYCIHVPPPPPLDASALSTSQ